MLKRTDIKTEDLFSEVMTPSLVITQESESAFTLSKVSGYILQKPDKLIITVDFGSKCWLDLQKYRYLNFLIPSQSLLNTIDTKIDETIILNKTNTDFHYWKGRYRQLPILDKSMLVLECETLSQMKLEDKIVFGNKIKTIWKDLS
jgi:hypothetical protein